MNPQEGWICERCQSPQSGVICKVCGSDRPVPYKPDYIPADPELWPGWTTDLGAKVQQRLFLAIVLWIVFGFVSAWLFVR